MTPTSPAEDPKPSAHDPTPAPDPDSSPGASESPRTARARKRAREFPHTYVILIVLGLIATLMSYLVPAGLYDRVAGPNDREVVDPESFRFIDQSPVTAVELLTAFPRGLVDAGAIVFFVFTIGGMFEVIRRTGLIETVLAAVARAFQHRGLVVIPVLMVPFSLIASLIGVPELALVYIPAIMPLMLKLGYDRIVTVAVALLGTGAGFTAGFLNPINTGLGQQITGLEPFSGIGLRMVLYVFFITTAVLYVMRYARRVAADPERSLLPPEERVVSEEEKLDLSQREVSGRLKAAGLVLLGLAGLLVYGIIAWGWFFPEFAGMFILIAIVVGLVGGLRPNQIATSMDEGMRTVLGGAMVVGIARGVAVLLEDGNILDTVVYGLGESVGWLPPVMFAIGMFLVQALFNLIVPSGSGQALVTLPVLGPLSDLLGVSRQTAVLAYQTGDGMTNMVYPTSGYFMAALSVGRVNWGEWMRFYVPLLGIWVAISIGFLIFAQLTGWN